MAQLLSFDDHALARLRARLGEAEEARDDLIAFAHGHAGAVNAIHEAVLAAIAARDEAALNAIVTEQWPAILGIDSAALAVASGDKCWRAGSDGVQPLAAPLLRRALRDLAEVTMRPVDRGSPLFGPASGAIRAEALIRLHFPSPTSSGLLLLGQRARPQRLDPRHGAHLLRFLGRSLGAMLGPWQSAPQS